jgi:site-specific DNA recombinase
MFRLSNSRIARPAWHVAPRNLPDNQQLRSEAAVVERIFRDFVAGQSPKQIAKTLNREGVAGPFGGKWSPSTIYGNTKRGTGILNNELYIGRMVWNRLQYVKDPDTGKRVSRLNPSSVWITTDVPHLRIVPDELWSAANAKRSPETGDLSLKIAMVAGARNQQYLEFAWSAA